MRRVSKPERDPGDEADLVFTDSMRPFEAVLDRSQDRDTMFTIRRCSSTNAGIRHRRAHPTQTSSVYTHRGGS